MFSFVAKRAFKSVNNSSSSDQPDKSGGVSWQEFNFPPCVTVVHFDPAGDPIPQIAKKTIFRMKYMWLLACGILILNLFTTIAFVAEGSDPKIDIFYSCLQLVVGAVAGGIVLYQGYRGVAGDLVRSSRIYLGCEIVLTILMIVFGSIQSGNIHGLRGITSRMDTATQPAYLVICILEGTAWMVCACFSLVCMYSVYKYPGHDNAFRREGVSDKQKKGSKHSRTAADEEEPPRKKPKGRAKRTERDEQV